jgi:hypothetical protein
VEEDDDEHEDDARLRWLREKSSLKKTKMKGKKMVQSKIHSFKYYYTCIANGLEVLLPHGVAGDAELQDASLEQNRPQSIT